MTSGPDSTADNADPFAPVRKEATVARPADRVFAFFTHGFSDWWPIDSHSLAREGSQGVTFPGIEGGRIVEILPDGRKAVWGIVRHFEAPKRLIFTWHPGRPADEATEIEVTFKAVDEETTRVVLEHRGWDILAADPVNWRAEYDRGWDTVFHQCFVKCTEK